MGRLKKVVAALFSASMIISSWSMTHVHADTITNIALNKKVTTSYACSGFGAEKAVDGDKSSRWATEFGEHAATNHWIDVDLGAQATISSFNIHFENPKDGNALQRVRKFKIEGSLNGSSYALIHNSADKPEGFGVDEVVTLDTPVQYRYVRLTVEKLRDGAYPSISVAEFEVMGTQEKTETPTNVNLALNKNVVVSAEYPTLPKKNLTDGNESTRWSTEGAPVQWFYVDLGKSESFNQLKMVWESNDVYAGSYNIYASDDHTNWGEAIVKRTGNKKRTSVEYLSSAKKARYVKVEVTKMEGYNSVSCCEFEVLNSSDKAPQNPTENVAFNKPAVASSVEGGTSFTAGKAFDGNTKGTSRWASDVKNAPHWIYVDLEDVLDVKTVRLTWETRKATKYRIQYATELDKWTDAKVFNSRPANKTQKIVLDKAVKARYVRLYIDAVDSLDPDTGINWNNISVYEMEVYGGEPTVDVSEMMDSITVAEVKKGDQKVNVTLPESEDYTITFNGADYEQLVGDDLTIYQPLVDTTATLSFKATNKRDKNDYLFKEIAVNIPGKYNVEQGDNAAPIVLPELREWKGHTGTFNFNKNGHIVVRNSKLNEMAKTFQSDLKEITGSKLDIVTSGETKAGDIVLDLVDKKENLGLDKEGYILEIGDTVSVKAEQETGAFWSTRTILQILKLNKLTMPKGMTRDYPLYSVRGLILDVGRKTFTMDNLTMLMKEMSWYKLNDFQVHLNDNVIPLENYSNAGKDPMTAYSGFRLESDIKKGGKNQADLTSTDVFYTKKAFRNFIKQSRMYGVNIVPEIDTPAHSLALTKVRPDLRAGTYGRDNDHLNLVTKYDESVAFVQEIFGEYMNGSDPVFDSKTTVHIGADEYTKDPNAYRRFCNDMIDYVEKSGRKARLWGSLSSLKGSVTVKAQNVEMNLWNYGWANMDKMYEEGFDLINCNDGNYYIVPNAGYYYDYLNNSTVYNLPINEVGGKHIPAGDKQMLGGSFAVWNDMTDYLNNGITEYDVYDRIQASAALFGAKLWGKGSLTQSQAENATGLLGDAPGTNFAYNVEDKDGVFEVIDNNTSYKGVNADVEDVDYKKAIHLLGDSSYVDTKLHTTVGLNNSLRFKVKRTSSSVDKDQILFESSYGSIKGVQKGTGKVAISRENFDITFDYSLPVGQWVEIEIKNPDNGRNRKYAELYVNGKLVDRKGDDEKVEGNRLIATTMIPFERVGSKTHAFVGYIDDIVLAKNKDYASTSELDNTLLILHALEADKKVDASKKDAMRSLIKEGEALTCQADPDAVRIADVVKRMKDLIATIIYKKADYSAIEAILAKIPNTDLTKIYTKDSLDALETAKSNIVYDLPRGMQSQVDAYAKDLQSALDRLVLLDVADLYYYQGTMTGTASSQETANEKTPASNALDGNPGTFWHTLWNGASLPHWYMITMGTTEKVDGLYYLPRSNAGNGTVTQYSIEVSTDGQTFKKVKEGTLPLNAEGKLISFDAVDAKYVRFNILAAKGGFGSAAEFKIHYVPATNGAEELEALIKHAEGLDRTLYTKESLEKLDIALEKAKAVLKKEDASANEINEAKTNLYNALLKDLIAKTPVIKEDADTKDLEDLVGSIDKNQKDYTEESWNKLQDALKKAQDVLNKEEPEQSEVDAAYKNLKDAIDGLEKVKDPVITPDKPSKPDENKPGETKPSDSKPSETKPSESKPSETKPNKKPQTSDLTPLASVFSSIFVSLSGIYLVMRKKEC